jgi:hypothetical protein
MHDPPSQKIWCTGHVAPAEAGSAAAGAGASDKVAFYLARRSFPAVIATVASWPHAMGKSFLYHGTTWQGATHLCQGVCFLTDSGHPTILRGLPPPNDGTRRSDMTRGRYLPVKSLFEVLYRAFLISWAFGEAALVCVMSCIYNAQY